MLETKNQNEESKSELSKFKQCPTLETTWHNFYCPIATNDFYHHASNAIRMLTCWKAHVISNTVLRSFTHKNILQNITISYYGAFCDILSITTRLHLQKASAFQKTLHAPFLFLLIFCKSFVSRAHLQTDKTWQTTAELDKTEE